MWIWIKAAMSSVGDFLLPFIKSFLTSVGPIVAQAAMAAVEAAAQNMVKSSGSQKYSVAFDAIVKDLKKQGIHIGLQVTNAMINRAIEAAVAKLEDK